MARRDLCGGRRATGVPYRDRSKEKGDKSGQELPKVVKRGRTR